MFHSIIPRRSASSIGDEGLLVAPVEERSSDDVGSVVHDRSGGTLERHQHSSHLIPSKGAAVDDQKSDFSASVRIAGDTADETIGVQ